jgi:glucokinase
VSVEDSDRVVAVDLGGTKTAVATVDRQGTCGPVLVRPTPSRAGPDRVLATVAEAVREVAAGSSFVAVGVGSAGVIDATTGTVVSATDAITRWPGTGVADALGKELGMPVVVDNDVNAHAAGEAWLGAGRGAASVLMVAVGTGVGGAVVLDGAPLHGAHHVAGEVGHVPARGAEHLLCGCGRRGHLEAVASGPGLLRHYRALGGDAAVTDTREVFERARSADPQALRAVEDAAGALGTCLAGLVMLVDPEVVIVGGGLADTGEVWWDPMECALRADLIDVVADVPLRRAELGNRAALVGAAHRAWSELGAGVAEAPR